MDQNEVEQWVTQLIQQNKIHDFYNSTIWKQTAKEILKEQKYECQRCKQKGQYEPARTVHHKKYLKEFPQLALEKSNLEAIGDRCHWEEHHKPKAFINKKKWNSKIIRKRLFCELLKCIYKVKSWIKMK